MSVQFEENKGYSFQPDSPKGITGWLIKKGWVNNESGAKKLMLVITLICFVAALVIAFV